MLLLTIETHEAEIQSHESITLTGGNHVSTHPEPEPRHQTVEDVLDQDAGGVLGPHAPSLEESKASLEQEDDEAVDEEEERVHRQSQLLQTDCLLCC